jgi:replication-associated recombination protein RarA
MDPAKKKDIMDDLDAFRNGKEYYAHVGKSWKRSYLLHGPPGTGKSSMIAVTAMANYLDYDIYDVELTSVVNQPDEHRTGVGGELGVHSRTTMESVVLVLQTTEQCFLSYCLRI